MQVPLPQEQLSAGSAGNIRSGPGVKPMEDVVTGDINRMSTAQLEIASTVLKIDKDLNDAKGKRIANDYYAEVHTKPLNSYCHTIGMPFTIYGMLLWIPMIFERDYKDYKKIQQFLYTFFWYQSRLQIVPLKNPSFQSFFYSISYLA